MPPEDGTADRCAGRILGKMRRITRRWKLFEGGARIALGLSGGRDSLVMLELMARMRQQWHPPLKLIAMHVRLDAGGEGPELPRRISDWVESLDLEMIEVSPRQEIPREGLRCFSCSRIRRRSLFEEAERRGYQLVALGHHADDVVETWLMSLLYSGSGDALPPRRDYFDGAISVIRPMIEIRRAEIARLARLAMLPVPIPPCPLEEGGKRAKVENALRSLRPDEKLVRRQLFWAAMRDLGASVRECGAPEGRRKDDEEQ